MPWPALKHTVHLGLLVAGMVVSGVLIWRGAGAPVEPARVVAPDERVIHLGAAGQYVIICELVVAPEALGVTALREPDMALSVTDPAGDELAVRAPGAGAWLYKILTRQRGHTHGVVSVPRSGDYRIRAELLAVEGIRPDRQVVLTFAPLRSPGRFLWLLLGLGGQICFSLRFLIQWLASEKAGRSTIPRAFWYYSLFGGMAILIYAIYTRDPVFILAYAFNTFIYLRNLALLDREDRCRPEPPAAPVRQLAGRNRSGRE